MESIPDTKLRGIISWSKKIKTVKQMFRGW